MRDIISKNTFAQTIDSIGNPKETARTEELLKLIEKWLSDPLVILDSSQKAIIEETIKKFKK